MAFYIILPVRSVGDGVLDVPQKMVCRDGGFGGQLFSEMDLLFRGRCDIIQM